MKPQRCTTAHRPAATATQIRGRTQTGERGQRGRARTTDSCAMGMGCECAKRPESSPPQSSVSIETPRDDEARAAAPSGRRDQKEKRVGESEAETDSPSQLAMELGASRAAGTLTLRAMKERAGAGKEAACGSRPARAEQRWHAGLGLVACRSEHALPARVCMGSQRGSKRRAVCVPRGRRGYVRRRAAGRAASMGASARPAARPRSRLRVIKGDDGHVHGEASDGAPDGTHAWP